MSLIERYEQGLLKDRIAFILSLSDTIEIELCLKKTSLTSYDDLQLLVFLSKSTKNPTNLIQIFKSDLLPVYQRADAAKAWLRLQNDEKLVQEFVIETITDTNIPRLIKHQILKSLHHLHYLKKSSSFFYNLACHLSEKFDHNEFNIAAHTLPFCSLNQISNLLSQWSLTCYSQIYFSSSFCSKLMRYQPLVIINLIQGDLNNKYTNDYELWNYFRELKKLFEFLVNKEPKAMCHFAIKHVNRLEKHKKILPGFIEVKQEHLFDKAPDEMIELISLVASYQPGIIKYQTPWDSSGQVLAYFHFPSSFSIDHYVRLFFVLYETCQWSLNHTLDLVRYMLHNDIETQNLSLIHKRRQWFFDIIIQNRLGKEFLNRLFKDGTESDLYFLNDFPELTLPFARHLQSQVNQSEIIDAEQYASFLRYERLTTEIFNKFLSLFQQIGPDINKRKRMYPRFLQCAISTDEQSVKHVLQWIEKRFLNEQLTVIEYFLQKLTSYNHRFHFEYFQENFKSIETIMDIASNHFQRTSTTVELILTYGMFLLIQAKNSQEKIEEFACKIIKQYYSSNITFPYDYILLPKASHLFAEILLSNIFPELISKYLITEINDFLIKCFYKPWNLPEIDRFLHSFFFEHLKYSKELQSAFNILEHSYLISLFLIPQSTQLERVYRLLNEIDEIFFLDINVQRIVLCSQQYRQFIDQILEDEKCINTEKLSKEKTNLSSNKIIPGFDIIILKNFSHQLTGKQQEQITKIILNDYLQKTDVSYQEKLKALHVLHRLTHTYQDTLQWIEKQQYPFLTIASDIPSNNKSTRGANIQVINHYILALPATFDLFPKDLFKQFDQLKTELNASNATYIKDAIFSISQKVTDEYFLKHFIEFIRNESFSKLGITANKAMLRLLIQYRLNSTIISLILKPLWDSRPHPDIRTCLVMILLQFVHESNMKNDDESLIWSILEEAAHDDCHRVVLALFGANEKGIRRPSKGLKYSSANLLQIFMKRIQMKILDHPTSLTSRIWAWSLLDSNYCDIDLIREKARQLCIQSDKNANGLWKQAFEKLLEFYKLKKISAEDLVDFIQSIINEEKQLDSDRNALDDENDLPIFHRINNLLDLFIAAIGEIDLQQRLCFRLFALSILQFETTMAGLVGRLLMKLVENKEDLEELLTNFQQYLPPVYFEHMLIRLASNLSAEDGSCPFVQQLSIDKKFELALWFINEKNQPLFVFDLLKNHVFNKVSVDRQQCQVLLHQMRQSKNLLLRQQALEYTVPWKKNTTDGVHNK